MNAHAFLVCIPTSAARTAMAVNSRESVSAALDTKVCRFAYASLVLVSLCLHITRFVTCLSFPMQVMLDPWVCGIPMLVVDGTTANELAARSWTHRDPQYRVFGSELDVLPFLSVSNTMNPYFYRIVRNGYTPYGLVSALDHNKRVFEVSVLHMRYVVTLPMPII